MIGRGFKGFLPISWPVAASTNISFIKRSKEKRYLHNAGAPKLAAVLNANYM
jgi:hypothetical protein